jgi:hypothetical protein
VLEFITTIAGGLWESLRAQVIRVDPAAAVEAEEAFGRALCTAWANLD